MRKINTKKRKKLLGKTSKSHFLNFQFSIFNFQFEKLSTLPSGSTTIIKTSSSVFEKATSSSYGILKSAVESASERADEPERTDTER